MLTIVDKVLTYLEGLEKEELQGTLITAYFIFVCIFAYSLAALTGYTGE